jgi:hypothetical protein
MPLGGKHRALFMTRENVPDAAAFERIIQRHDSAARIAKNQMHTLGAQTLQEDFGTFKH